MPQSAATDALTAAESVAAVKVVVPEAPRRKEAMLVTETTLIVVVRQVLVNPFEVFGFKS